MSASYPCELLHPTVRVIPSYMEAHKYSAYPHIRYRLLRRRTFFMFMSSVGFSCPIHLLFTLIHMRFHALFLGYKSPLLFAPFSRNDWRLDIWSIAICLLQLLCFNATRLTFRRSRRRAFVP